MESVEARQLVFKPAFGSDFVEEVKGFCVENDIKSGFFHAIGAVQDAKIAYYDQQGKRYRELVFDEPLELASCIGNVTLKDGGVFVHAHAVFANEAGDAFGGHLVSAKVFAGEVFFTAFGEAIERAADEETGLYLIDV